jgi:hypothetical protein
MEIIISFVLVSLAIYYFVFIYFDIAEMTGSRNWPLLRFVKKPSPHPMLYVLKSDESVNLAIGYDFVYQLPHFLFHIPFARDVLLWFGGISDKADVLNIKTQSVCVQTTNITFFNHAYAHKLKVVPIRSKRGKMITAVEMDPEMHVSGEDYMHSYNVLLLNQ